MVKIKSIFYILEMDTAIISNTNSENLFFYFLDNQDIGLGNIFFIPESKS